MRKKCGILGQACYGAMANPSGPAKQDTSVTSVQLALQAIETCVDSESTDCNRSRAADFVKWETIPAGLSTMNMETWQHPAKVLKDLTRLWQKCRVRVQSLQSPGLFNSRHVVGRCIPGSRQRLVCFVWMHLHLLQRLRTSPASAATWHTGAMALSGKGCFTSGALAVLILHGFPACNVVYLDGNVS